MGLYERWTDDSDEGTSKIAIHVFGAAMSELARGAVTRQQVIDAFGLAGDDVTELDAIAATYTAQPDAAAKDEFVGKLEDVMVLSEAGFYTKAKAQAELGF